MKTIRKSSSMPFTLSELILIIGVIAIFAALQCKAISGGNGSGSRVQCAGNLKTIGEAAIMYAQDNADYMPAGTTVYSEASMRWNYGYAKALGYQTGRELSLCFNKYPEIKLACPGATPDIGFTYGANSIANGKFGNSRIPFTDYAAAGETYKSLKMSELEPGVGMVGDSEGRLSCANPRQTGNKPSRDVSGDKIMDSAAANYFGWAPMRHDGGMNMVFPDGSVKFKKFAEFQDSVNKGGFIYNPAHNL